MKKKSKILVSVLSAAMMMTSLMMPASAGLEGEKTYYKNVTKDDTVVPVQVHELLTYAGVVVTMPDNTVPTPEKLGVDCNIKEYMAENYEKLYEKLGDDIGWGYEQMTPPDENQYLLNTSQIMSEDEAIDYCKKLVIRGIVKNAEVLYVHQVSNGYIDEVDGKVSIRMTYNKDYDVSGLSINDYPEIKEMLKFSDYEIEFSHADTYPQSNPEAKLTLDIDSSSYNNNGKYDYVSILNDVQALEKVMLEKYDELSAFYLEFYHEYSCDESDAVYFIEPTWGDATNDDKIDLYDAIEISKYIMGSSDLDEDTVLLADVNRDGKTDIYDVIEIAKMMIEEK